MTLLLRFLLAASSLLSFASACSDCSGSQQDVVQTRHVRRSQPEAQNATSGPKSPLEWGQINFLQTTDTHGWLEGHLKEPNYGADWGDFVSFTKALKKKAHELEVDLLLVDTGVSSPFYIFKLLLNFGRIYMMVLD
jgi:2',3'-cyclic-nucleotide 2'-phosphodiesterase (5'-nucleotidase family)